MKEPSKWDKQGALSKMIDLNPDISVITVNINLIGKYCQIKYKNES